MVVVVAAVVVVAEALLVVEHMSHELVPVLLVELVME